MVLQIGLSQNKCKYPKGLDVQFSLPSGNILTASDAKFKVSISNHDKKSVYVYDTLIDGDLFGFDSNFWIELRIQDSGKQWKEIRTYYGSNIPEGDSYQSQLTKSDLSSNETKVLYFDLFPNYVKYLKAGFYVAKIGIRKIPRSRKKDCGEYYLSKEIFFEVINEIR
jgi:hypothetical protein